MHQKLKKKINIYLTFDGLSDQLGKSQILPYMESFLIKENDFFIFSLEKKDNLLKFIKPNFLKNKKVFWEKKNFSNSKNKFVKLIELIKFFLMCFNVCRNKNVQTIHCRGLQPALIGFLLKYIFKSKMIFDMRGLWVDEKLDMGTLNKKKIVDKSIYTFLKNIENFILKNTDHLVVLTNKVKEYVVNKKLLKPEKISVIPCSVDYQLFAKNSELKRKDTFYKYYAIPENSIIMTYCGSLSGYYMLDEMLNFFEQLSSKKKNVFFLLITADLKVIENKLKNKDYKNNIIFLKAEWNEVPFYLSLSKFMVSFIKPTFAKIASSPTKIAEAMALGVPVVSNSGIGDLDELIENNDLGGIIELDSNKINQFIEHNMEKILTFSKQTIINNSFNLFDIKKSKANYKKIYEKLT